MTCRRSPTRSPSGSSRPGSATVPATTPRSSRVSLPRFQRFRLSPEPHATPSRQALPISPGCWRPVDCRWESSARRPRHRAPNMRSRTCWRWRAAVRDGPAAPHGMQVTVATRLAVRVWQLVDRTIRSTRARVRVPNESTCRDAVARAFTAFDAQTVEECWTAYSAKRKLAARAQVGCRGTGHRLGDVRGVTHAVVARRIRRGKPRERSPDPGRGSRRGL